MKTIAWIPAGRTKYLEILIPYLLKEKEVLNRVYFCLNTENSTDIEFMQSVCKQHPDYFECLPLDEGIKPNGRFTVPYFYKYFTDEETIYLKIDDDICFLQKGLIKELIQFRKTNKAYFLVCANLVNNVLCSYIHQRLGALNYQYGIYKWEPFCKIGWEKGKSAENAHKCFLAALREGRWQTFLFSKWEIPEFTRISINLICYFGVDAKIFSLLIQEAEDDEKFLSEIMPPNLGRVNCIYGNKIGAHLAYYMQRDYLEQNTDLLEQYYLVSLKNEG